MVKILKGMKPAEIVSLKDLTATISNATGISNPSIMHSAESSVQALDKWISLLDRGVTMVGRLDSIVGKVRDMRLGSDMTGTEFRMERLPRKEANQRMESINKDIKLVESSGEKKSDETKPVSEPAPGPGPGPGGAFEMIQKITAALAMVETAQPGITVAELRESLARNPEASARILAAALQGAPQK